MKRAVIFLNGNKPKAATISQYIKQSDTIICADGGANHAVALGLTPDVYIGDLDSIRPAIYKKLQKEQIEFHIYKTEKDETDSEMALHYVLKKGFTDIVFFGVFGSRVDHMLANLTMFAKVPKDMKITIIEGNQELYFVHKSISLSGKIGEYVSLIPFDGDVTGITSTGLKWQLTNGTLAFGKSRGVSNEFIQKTAEIFVKKGVLFVIHTKG